MYVLLKNGLKKQTIQKAFEAWIKALPESNSPAWIGLPVTAESQLKAAIAQRTLANLNLLQGSAEDHTGASDEVAASLLLKNVEKMSKKWLAVLPTESSLPHVEVEQTSDANVSPLVRCLAREVMKGRKVICLVVEDLNLLMFFFFFFF
jgi:hypothetical protein